MASSEPQKSSLVRHGAHSVIRINRLLQIELVSLKQCWLLTSESRSRLNLPLSVCVLYETVDLEVALLLSILCCPRFCLFLSAAVLSALGAGCQQESESLSSSEPPPLPAISEETILVEMRAWPALIRTQGSLIADEVVVIGTRVEGLVDQVHVDLGDRVTAGQPLVTLRQEQFQLELERAEAQLQQVRSAIGLKAEDSLDAVDPENSPPVRERRAEWQDALAELTRGKGLLEGKPQEYIFLK